MKRFARFTCFLLIVLMMCLTLIGCRKKEEPASPTGPSQVSEETEVPTMEVEEETDIELPDGAGTGGF